MVERDWYGAYKEGWTGAIVPEAFCHPAKFSRGLIRRIYQHAFDQGWLAAGQTVLDPFAGVALGALEAMRRGLAWVGCELEEKFVTLGRQNIDLWNDRYAAHLPGWGSAVLIRGDSRELARVVQEAGCCVSSPPYAHIGNIGLSEKEIEIMKANEATGKSSRRQNNSREAIEKQKKLALTSYGATPGQLAAMPPGEFGGVVSSPPYEGDQLKGGGAKHDKVIDAMKAGYGATPGQIGEMQSDTFWSAARTIVEQTHLVLRPGAVAIWVVKAFVRNKERVDFPGQWQALCEACGFEPLEWIRAWLVEDSGTQVGMFGEDKRLRKERKSFFRRLAEKKGSPPIDYEVVLVMRKPVGAGGGDVAAVVSSPPYTGDALGHSRGNATEAERMMGSPDVSYGTTPAQLANLPEGSLAAALAPADAEGEADGA